MTVLLYHPLVKPPTEVLHQALLYWDGIATVVPRSPVVYEAAVSPLLRELRERSFYTPLPFGTSATEMLTDPYGPPRGGFPTSQVLCRELWRLAEGPNPPRLPSPPDTFLYHSKLEHWLEEELLNLGLAERHGHGPWSLAVPKEVLQLIVGVMATQRRARRGVCW